MRKKMTRKQLADQQKWLAVRKRAGRRIDPETAEVMWDYVWVYDPYMILPHPPPEEFQEADWNYYVRSPGSDVWVSEGHLPIAARHALRPITEEILKQMLQQPGSEWHGARWDLIHRGWQPRDQQIIDD